MTRAKTPFGVGAAPATNSFDSCTQGTDWRPIRNVGTYWQHASMSPSTKIAVGQVIRYPDPPSQATECFGGYRNFFNLTVLPGAPRLIMNRGIDNPAWVGAPEGPRRPVILIRSNPLQAGTAKTPWQDVFDMDAGHLLYYGDHKADTTSPPGSTRGNAALLAASEAHQADAQDIRALAVPLLIFRSVERNNQTKGYLEFCGLGLVEQVKPIEQQDSQTGKSFPNYVYDIALLDLSAEGDQLDWQWINARRDRHLAIDETNELAPSSWHSWIEIGNIGLSKLRRRTQARTGQIRASGDSVRSPDWAWDELVLACALVHRNGWREVKRTDQRALELSDMLQLLPIHPGDKRGDDFRNPNSIQRKTADLATAHPNYPGRTTKGGHLTQQVVGEFIKRPHKMLSAADHIMSALVSGEPNLLESIAIPDPDEHEVTAVEGRTLERVHRYRERAPQLRKEKIRSVLRDGGVLACEVCSFNFAQRFGNHGEGYIEVHHVVPLHETGKSQTKLEDLALLCANCHRMSHRRLENSGTWPSPVELRAILSKGRRP
jgi:5-methylcytosine-specific restriction protein A